MSWVPLIEAAAVAAGQVVTVPLGADDVVVWRTGSGEAVVCESRCPHQWSHLGHEGAVDGDELVCVTHCWRFDRAGRGSKVNVRGRRDPKGDVAVLPSREREGRIEVLVEGGSAPAAS